jgi:hypothetical protein
MAQKNKDSLAYASGSLHSETEEPAKSFEQRRRKTVVEIIDSLAANSNENETHRVNSEAGLY